MASIKSSRLVLGSSKAVSSFLRRCPEAHSSKCIQRLARRTMATETVATPPLVPAQSSTIRYLPIRPDQGNYKPTSEVVAMSYKFPNLELAGFGAYPISFLHLPLRRDILQRAVIYEGDRHRFGRAKTKWRAEVHGTGKKMRPQKGLGRARLGDKKSPMLRGGGRAHGPKPRDFSTKLPRKIYNMAWRTALSWRYKRGTLVVINGKMHHKVGEEKKSILEVLHQNRWDNKSSLFITMEERPLLVEEMKEHSRYGRVLTLKEVDVKDLLENGRIIIEKAALDHILEKRGYESGHRFSAASQSTRKLGDHKTKRI